MNVKPDSSHPNSQYSFNSPRKQNFSLPNDAIGYILNNCSLTNFLQKLQQTCKYFFAKKKVIVIDEHVDYLNFDNWEHFYYKKNLDVRDNYDLKPSKKGDEMKKYWLTNSLLMRCKLQPPTYFTYIYRCNLKSLKISYQTLSFEEIRFLLNGKNVEILSLYLCKIKYGDGLPVSIDAILEQCPKITDLNYFSILDDFSVAIMERLNLVQLTTKLEMFNYAIFHLENDFYKQALELLCKFIHKNVKPREDRACAWIYLLEGYYNYQKEFEDLINQNLPGWYILNIRTGQYSSDNSRREADVNKNL